MLENVKHLQTPLSPEDVKNLRIGDLVTITGTFFSCRSKFHVKLLRENYQVPPEIEGINVMCHMGPIMKRDGEEWRPVSGGPTTSFRMDRFGPEMIKKLNLRAIIGKGTMGEKTMAAMRDEGCVHISSIGGSGNSFSNAIQKVVSVNFFEEFGMLEAVWVFKVKKWGPYLVDIDTTGNNYFTNIDSKAKQRLPEILKRLGVDPEYQYSRF